MRLHNPSTDSECLPVCSLVLTATSLKTKDSGAKNDDLDDEDLTELCLEFP